MSYVQPIEITSASSGWGVNLTNADPDLVQLLIDAVERKLLLRYVDYLTPADPGPVELYPDVKLAVMMQVARLYSRRNTPNGWTQFGTEVVVRVNRFDPDIADLLVDYEPAHLAVI